MFQSMDLRVEVRAGQTHVEMPPSTLNRMGPWGVEGRGMDGLSRGSSRTRTGGHEAPRAPGRQEKGLERSWGAARLWWEMRSLE